MDVCAIRTASENNHINWTEKSTSQLTIVANVIPLHMHACTYINTNIRRFRRNLFIPLSSSLSRSVSFCIANATPAAPHKQKKGYEYAHYVYMYLRINIYIHTYIYAYTRNESELKKQCELLTQLQIAIAHHNNKQ